MSAEPKSVQARSLKHHLDELKVLYEQIPATIVDQAKAATYDLKPVAAMFADLAQTFVAAAGLRKRNPLMPEEDFIQFVLCMLDTKKMVIERLVSR